MAKRRFQPGQPLDLRASELNDWQAAAEKLAGTAPPVSGQTPTIQIPVRNTHTAAIKAFSVGALADALHDPTADLSQFLGNTAIDITPFTSSNSDATPVIVPDYIEAGEMGLATIMGVQAALVNVTDAEHTSAKPSEDTDWQLDSASAGSIPILWKEAGIGQKWALVAFGANSGSVAVASGSVVVLSSSVSTGPVSFESLTYEVQIIETGETVTGLGTDESAANYRTTPITRHNESLSDGSGGTTGWKVDPARPGTYGEVKTYPKYNGATPVAGETVRVFRLFDERPHVEGCA